MKLSRQQRHIIKMTYKTSKLGQTDLAFGLQSEFISRSAHGGLQVYSTLHKQIS